MERPTRPMSKVLCMGQMVCETHHTPELLKKNSDSSRIHNNILEDTTEHTYHCTVQ